MKRVLTNAQMRAADEYTINTKGVASQTLMHRAGVAIADEVEKAAKQHGTAITVVCGTGNNGGDGYVCASELLRRGYNVKVYALEGKLSLDCARERARYSGEYAAEIGGDIIVDCIFGTGLSREIVGECAEIIRDINISGGFVVAADIPSGICGDNGCVMGCAVKADITVAIGELKVGHVYGDALDYCGKVLVKDIGIECRDDGYAVIYNDIDIKAFYPPRKRNSHKGTFGRANLACGSAQYAGAAALGLSAALQSGCGYVRLTTCDDVKNALAALYPQTIFNDDVDLTSDCIAIGSGRGVSEQLYEQIVRLVANYGGTLIIDADGLNSLAKYGAEVLKRAKCRVILTPHLKEFSRLTGESCQAIAKNPLYLAQKFAKEYKVVLVLKSAATIICDGERTAINTRGDSALAKGGSGDMLTGFMCGTVARGLSPFDGAVCAVYTLGVAAELSSAEKTEYCATAQDIIRNLFFAVKRLTDLNGFDKIKNVERE